MEETYFAAGCFWGVEHKLQSMPGVKETAVGYMNGHTERPSYKEVCTDTTGHAEAVKVVFDPSQISFLDLCQKFWEIHDPTTLNRQGPDTGSQYRSDIYFTTEEQQKQAQSLLAKIQKNFSAPVVTEILAAQTFYPAEEYHQKYFIKNGGSCGI